MLHAVRTIVQIHNEVEIPHKFADCRNNKLQKYLTGYIACAVRHPRDTLSFFSLPLNFKYLWSLSQML